MTVNCNDGSGTDMRTYPWHANSPYHPAMPKRTALVLACLLASCAVAQTESTSAPATAPATTQAALPTPAELIARYVAVTGGPEAYASLKSRRATGTFALPDLGISGKLEALLRGDGHALITIDVPGIGLVRQGMTGDVVWSIHPTEGPKLLTGVEAETTRRSLRLAPEISLDGYKESNVTGRADVNGRPAYQMELVADTGTRETRFYDVESGLLVKSIGIVASGAGELNVTTFFTDYEDAPPIRIASKVRQSMSGVSPEQAFTKIEHNVELPDALFVLPAEIVELQKAAK